MPALEQVERGFELATLAPALFARGDSVGNSKIIVGLSAQSSRRELFGVMLCASMPASYRSANKTVMCSQIPSGVI